MENSAAQKPPDGNNTSVHDGGQHISQDAILLCADLFGVSGIYSWNFHLLALF